MLLFLGLSGSDLVFYGILVLIGAITLVYIKLKRMGGLESDYLSDDADTSDSDDADGGDD